VGCRSDILGNTPCNALGGGADKAGASNLTVGLNSFGWDSFSAAGVDIKANLDAAMRFGSGSDSIADGDNIEALEMAFGSCCGDSAEGIGLDALASCFGGGACSDALEMPRSDCSGCVAFGKPASLGRKIIGGTTFGMPTSRKAGTVFGMPLSC